MTWSLAAISLVAVVVGWLGSASQFSFLLRASSDDLVASCNLPSL